MRSVHLSLSGTGTAVEFRVPETDPAQTPKPPMSSDKRLAYGGRRIECRRIGDADSGARCDHPICPGVPDLAAEGGKRLPRRHLRGRGSGLTDGDVDGDLLRGAALLRAHVEGDPTRVLPLWSGTTERCS